MTPEERNIVWIFLNWLVENEYFYYHKADVVDSLEVTEEFQRYRDWFKRKEQTAGDEPTHGE